MVIHYFTFVAREVREHLARLGYRSLDEVIGRTDLLQAVPLAEYPKAYALDLKRLLADPDPSRTRPRKRVQPRNDRPGDVPLDNRILKDAAPSLKAGTPVQLAYRIRNENRTVGARVAGAIALKHGDKGLPENTISIQFDGTAGQSFGAFLANGMRLVLRGEANDYVGKGMTGGEIVIVAPEHAAFVPSENVIIGNTVLYGATGGQLFVAGRAGERFAVRNSGAIAVVEGVGNHGCEYMTGGIVVILGETGVNFGAGMSGGIAYVLDEAGEFSKRFNPELVQIERVKDAEDAEMLKSLLTKHHVLTGSKRAAEILDGWQRCQPKFWKVFSNVPVAKTRPSDVLRRDLMPVAERKA
ncbi:MAG: hypothetical protein AAB502_02995 [Chloroflexota bacterium]